MRNVGGFFLTHTVDIMSRKILPSIKLLNSDLKKLRKFIYAVLSRMKLISNL